MIKKDSKNLGNRFIKETQYLLVKNKNEDALQIGEVKEFKSKINSKQKNKQTLLKKKMNNKKIHQIKNKKSSSQILSF